MKTIGLLGGMSWGFGDDALWTFKKVGDKIHAIRRNVRYKASKKGPTADALKLEIGRAHV